MTPTLLGRWQTRLLLLGTVGVLITLMFGALYSNFITPLALLGYVIVIGFGWDILYNFLQTCRWERDWPPIFFAGAGLIEGIFIWGLIKAAGLWHLFGLNHMPGVAPDLTAGRFIAHYSTVWLVTFLILLGPMKIILVNWRFRGGRLL
jgi:hypothetical protein